MAKTLANATAAERKAQATRAKGGAGRRKATNVQEEEKESEKIPAAPPLDTISLDDGQLLRALKGLGANVGPINDGTRALYQRRLGKLLKEKCITNLDQIDIEKTEKNDGEGEKKERKERKKKVEARVDLKKGKAEYPMIAEKSEEEEKEEKEKSTQKGRGRKMTIESDDESEMEMPIQKQMEKRSDERRDERKTSHKKVSFASTGRRTNTLSDGDESDDDHIPPVQISKAKRKSVRIVAEKKNVDKKNEEKMGDVIRDERLMHRRTIVIEEEEEEEEERIRMNNTRESVRDSIVNKVEEMKEMTDEEEIDHSPIRRASRRIEEMENEEDQGEDENEEQEEGADTTLVFEKDEEEIQPIPSDGEKDGGKEENSGGRIEYADEEEMDEDSIPHNRSPIMRRLMLTVDTPVEERVRRSAYERRREESRRETSVEDEDERRKTIDMFNPTSLDTGRNDGIYTKQHPSHRNVSQILEEAEDMEISEDSEDETAIDEKKVNSVKMKRVESSRRIKGDLSRRLFLDDSDDMVIAGDSPDATIKSLKRGDTLNPMHSLIVDTPKSSKTKNDEMKEEGGPRNIRKMMGEKREEAMSSRDETNPRVGSRMDEMSNLSHLGHSGIPLEDTFTNLNRRLLSKHLEESIGMDTFNDGIERDGRNRMNSTRYSEAHKRNGKTFVVAREEKLKAKDEERNDGTFVVLPNRDKEKEKSRVPLSLPSSSPSPSRNPRKTYVVRSPMFVPPHSPSRFVKKSLMIPSPSRSRLLPPKPMPRKIRTDAQSVAPPPSISVAPPVPAPRRVLPLSSINENGAKKEVSPVTLFNTQPRVRIDREALKREFTPDDNMKIDKLQSLRQSMRQRKLNGQNTRDMELEAREIVENDHHLMPFFY